MILLLVCPDASFNLNLGCRRVVRIYPLRLHLKRKQDNLDHQRECNGKTVVLVNSNRIIMSQPTFCYELKPPIFPMVLVKAAFMKRMTFKSLPINPCSLCSAIFLSLSAYAEHVGINRQLGCFKGEMFSVKRDEGDKQPFISCHRGQSLPTGSKICLKRSKMCVQALQPRDDHNIVTGLNFTRSVYRFLYRRRTLFRRTAQFVLTVSPSLLTASVFPAADDAVKRHCPCIEPSEFVLQGY